MLFWTTAKLAIRSLSAGKLRTFLAVLGIIIGVASVISMIAVGSGARNQVLDQISKVGTNLLVIRPGQSGTGGVLTGTRKTLTVNDAQTLMTSVPGIQYIAPVVSGAAQLKHLNKNRRTMVLASCVAYFPMRNFTIDTGRILTEDECEKSGRSVVLGPVTAKALFESESAIGKIIKVNGLSFTVVGVLKSKGDLGFFSLDDLAIVPYTTGMSQLFGQSHVNEINIQTQPEVDLDALQANIVTQLRKNHRLLPDAANDFTIRNQAESLEMVNKIAGTFTVLLGSIAGISLLVGGIGIMNIMLVTVTERTREIGVRKAIGATDRDILTQFLLESVLLSGLGGLLGVAVGLGFANLVSAWKDFQIVVEASNILIALSFSISVGVFFGYYPAYRAAKLDPIDALRYE